MADVYAVPCPNCFAHIGEPCRNGGTHMAFAHLTRRRIAQRRYEAHLQRDRRREGLPVGRRTA